jgi:O-antigen ligase
MDPRIRVFIVWLCNIILVQFLARRPGFFHRFTIVIFILGMLAVPFFGLSTGDSVERARAEVAVGGSMQNAGGVGVWFGFCTVAMIIFGFMKQGARRTLYWLAAIVSLFVVGLTVTRTAMLGIALALAVSFRVVLRRGFVPVLILILLSGLVYESGLFQESVSKYTERGLEETGRFVLWPPVIHRIIDSPLFGVGYPNLSTDIPGSDGSISTPHNSFLFFGLSSGLLPLALYLIFWIQMARRSFFTVSGFESSALRLPLLVYAFITFFLSDISTEPWAILCFTVASGLEVPPVRDHLLTIPLKSRSRLLAPRWQVTSRS